MLILPGRGLTITAAFEAAFLGSIAILSWRRFVGAIGLVVPLFAALEAALLPLAFLRAFSSKLKKTVKT